MLQIRDISLAYQEHEVLRGVSLEATRGAIVSLIGANGAGKTSTLRAIVGLTPIRSGEILFEGERIDALDTADIVARGIALSPEGRRVFPQMSVYENLLVGAYLQKDKGVVRRTVDMVYDHFPRLSERRSQLAGSLSGGEQQMLAIGRALMTRPKLLLLDEPSLGLAPLVVREIGRILLDISRKENISIVLVEQNANLALRLCRYAYVLETGRIALEGDRQQLLDNAHVRKAYFGI